MVDAAHSLVRALQECLTRYALKGYDVVTTGHSLGGAVAALTALLLRAKDIPAQAYTFGTPACVELALAQECGDYVTTVVCGDDLVPRLSAYNTAELSHRLASLPWRKILLTEATWWDDMVKREQLPDLNRALLVKDLCVSSDSKAVSESFTDWLRSHGQQSGQQQMLHLLPPGKICYLAKATPKEGPEVTVPLMLHAHDLVMVWDSPMCLQVAMPHIVIITIYRGLRRKLASVLARPYHLSRLLPASLVRHCVSNDYHLW